MSEIRGRKARWKHTGEGRVSRPPLTFYAQGGKKKNVKRTEGGATVSGKRGSVTTRYKKRRDRNEGITEGTEEFSLRGNLSAKDIAEITAGYSRRRNETKRQFENRVLREKRLEAGIKVPVGKRGQVRANIARDSGMENVDADHPWWGKFSNKHKAKPNWSGSVGTTVPLGDATANIDMYHDPGQASINRKDVTGIDTRIDIPIEDISAYLQWKEHYEQGGGRYSRQGIGASTDALGGNLGLTVSQERFGENKPSREAMFRWGTRFNKGGKVKKRKKK